MTTLKHSPQQTTLDELMSSRGDSPAKDSAKQEKEKAVTMIATSGQKCLELYKLSSQHGSLLKMFVESLVLSKAWFSSKCVLTWKMKDTKFKRSIFQLAASTPRTGEKGSGLLPTARASMANGASQKEIANGNPKGRLKTEIAMLPTPQAIDAAGKGRAPRLKKDMKRNPDTPGSWRADLKDVVYGNKTGLKLQPNFVAWMMGFPQNWTDLNYPNQSIERNN